MSLLETFLSFYCNYNKNRIFSKWPQCSHELSPPLLFWVLLFHLFSHFLSPSPTCPVYCCPLLDPEPAWESPWESPVHFGRFFAQMAGCLTCNFVCRDIEYSQKFLKLQLCSLPGTSLSDPLFNYFFSLSAYHFLISM